MKKLIIASVIAAFGFSVSVQAEEPAKFQMCKMCHSSGVGPQVGDKAAWEPRLAKGMDVLVANAKKGTDKGMPPMGLCSDCTDEDFKEVIKFMSGQ